jgi:hypothetical protein
MLIPEPNALEMIAHATAVFNRRSQRPIAYVLASSFGVMSPDRRDLGQGQRMLECESLLRLGRVNVDNCRA